MKFEYYVKLVYFKANGKYYSSSSYLTEKTELFEIWAEVAQFRDSGVLPGLISGSAFPIISVRVPMHPNRHPHLVVDMSVE